MFGTSIDNQTERKSRKLSQFSSYVGSRYLDVLIDVGFYFIAYNVLGCQVYLYTFTVYAILLCVGSNLKSKNLYTGSMALQPSDFVRYYLLENDDSIKSQEPGSPRDEISQQSYS